jgi:DNA-binding transcriptional ArsR family regulator
MKPRSRKHLKPHEIVWLNTEEMDKSLEAAGKHGFVVYAAMCALAATNRIPTSPHISCTTAEIASLCGLSKRSATKALKLLEQAGVVSVVRAPIPGASNVYTIKLPTAADKRRAN